MALKADETTFENLDLSKEDLDAEKALHRIEIFEREIRYQPEKMPSNDTLLKKIVGKIVAEAITKFNPASIDDLHFDGNAKMQTLAKEIALKQLSPAKSDTLTISSDNSEKLNMH